MRAESEFNKVKYEPHVNPALVYVGIYFSTVNCLTSLTDGQTDRQILHACIKCHVTLPQ